MRALTYMLFSRTHAHAQTHTHARAHTHTHTHTRQGRVGKARSAEFELPREMSRLVLEEGLELGDAHDVVMGTVGSKRRGGTVGALTDGIITRAGCVCARAQTLTHTRTHTHTHRHTHTRTLARVLMRTNAHAHTRARAHTHTHLSARASKVLRARLRAGGYALLRGHRRAL